MKKSKILLVISFICIIFSIMLLTFYITKITDGDKNPEEISEINITNLEEEDTDKEVSTAGDKEEVEDNALNDDTAQVYTVELENEFYVEFLESDEVVDDSKREVHVKLYYKAENIFESVITLEANPEDIGYDGKVISTEYGYDVYLDIDNFFNFVTLKISVNFDGEVISDFESVAISKTRHDAVKYLGLLEGDLYITITPYMAGSPGQHISFYVLDSELNIISDVNEHGFSENIYTVPNDRYVSSISASLEEGSIKIEYEYYETLDDLIAHEKEPQKIEEKIIKTTNKK